MERGGVSKGLADESVYFIRLKNQKSINSDFSHIRYKTGDLLDNGFSFQ